MNELSFKLGSVLAKHNTDVFVLGEMVKELISLNSIDSLDLCRGLKKHVPDEIVNTWILERYDYEDVL